MSNAQGRGTQVSPSHHLGTYMTEEEGEDGSLRDGYGEPCLWTPW